MLTPYRSLLAVPGAARFVLSSLCARLGGAMFGVSTIVMIAGLRGSYALAGALSGVGLAAMALGGPLLARLVDRRGQTAVVVPASIGCLVCLAGFYLACRVDAPDWTLFVAALGTGLVPQVGTLVRARWAHILRDDQELLHTANSGEQVLEELCFMAGPATGAALSATVAPEAGFLLALALVAVGIASMMAQRSLEPPVHPADEHHTGAAVRAPGIVLLALGLSLTGAVFGSSDVSVIAFADAHGAKAWAGLTLGMFAGGSAVGGLVYGARPHPGTLAPRLLWFHLALCALLLPILLIDSVVVLGAALFVAGMAIAPTLITATVLAQRLVPASQITEGMTIVFTGILLGISVGSFCAGQVIERWGPDHALVVPIAAAAVAVVLAVAGRHRVMAAEDRAQRLWGRRSS